MPKSAFKHRLKCILLHNLVDKNVESQYPRAMSATSNTKFFHREILSTLNTWMEKKRRLPLLLSGARQVGKTSILKRFGETRFQNTVYLNFEKQIELHAIFEGDLNPSSLLKEIELRVNKKITPKETLLIFDEVQAAPQALTSLKYFAEELPELCVCAAGSLLGVALADSSFPVGKVDRMWVGPLKFGEFLQAVDQSLLYEAYERAKIERAVSRNTHALLMEQYRLFTTLGGLPGVIEEFLYNQSEGLQTALTRAREKQVGILKDYQDDITKHSGKIRAFDITKVLESIPQQLGRSLDLGAKKYIFKGVLPGKSSWETLSSPIEWLLRAGLIYKVEIVNEAALPLSSYASDNRFKLYFFDAGLLGALADLPIGQLYLDRYGTAKGVFAENVALQLLVTDSKHGIYCWEKNQAEVEFVTSSEHGVLPIEVKASHRTRAKSLDSYIKRYRPSMAIVLADTILRFDRERRIQFLGNYFAEGIRELVFKGVEGAQ